MQQVKQHIIFRLFAFFLAIALFAPLALKLAHVFEHQEHKLCVESDNANFHECELDCPFFKYNLQQYYLNYQNYEVGLYLSHSFKIPSLRYHFSYNNNPLSFSLRGPPALV